MTSSFSHMEVILASTSTYRIEQLKNFGLEFRALPPPIDEESLKTRHLSPLQLSRYLACKKAKSISQKHPHDLIIGADQLVNLKGKILGKPHSRGNAIAMLQKMSGKTHKLITSLCLIYKGHKFVETVVAKITLRKLGRDEIISYVYRDSPLDCAGSYKFELSGLSLVKKMSVSDPSSLVGIPLISLTKLLLKTGVPIPFVKQR